MPSSRGAHYNASKAGVVLASDEAAYITGAAFPIDGGSTLL